MADSLSCRVGTYIFRLHILSEHGRELPTIQLALQVGTVIPHLTAEVFYGEPGSTEQVFEVIAAQVYDQIEHDVSTCLIQPFNQHGIIAFPKHPGDTDQFFCHDNTYKINPFSVFIATKIGIPTNIRIILINQF